MYYEDLTPFQYHTVYSGLNVGWLDGEHEFPVRKPTDEFLDALAAVIGSGRFTKCAAAGLHFCEICDSREVLVERNHQEVFMGNTEIAIRDKDVTYIAPSLVYHYVETHHYLPPEPFVRGILNARLRTS